MGGPRGRARYPSHPLGPPPGRSVTLNGLPSPFSLLPHTGGPALDDQWSDVWSATPAPVRTTLSTWATSPSASFAPIHQRSAPPSQGWAPIRQDNLASAFPWHLLRIFDQPLPTISTSFVRRSLQACRGPRTPKWPSPALSRRPPPPPSGPASGSRSPVCPSPPSSAPPHSSSSTATSGPTTPQSTTSPRELAPAAAPTTTASLTDTSTARPPKRSGLPAYLC
ncbi:hypothetical protein CF319_g4657 [Tilletia indica]|nr:hypothetical protein CF319_g4657 [Tilletia indica]